MGKEGFQQPEEKLEVKPFKRHGGMAPDMDAKAYEEMKEAAKKQGVKVGKKFTFKIDGREIEGEELKFWERISRESVEKQKKEKGKEKK